MSQEKNTINFISECMTLALAILIVAVMLMMSYDYLMGNTFYEFARGLNLPTKLQYTDALFITAILKCI